MSSVQLPDLSTICLVAVDPGVTTGVCGPDGRTWVFEDGEQTRAAMFGHLLEDKRSYSTALRHIVIAEDQYAGKNQHTNLTLSKGAGKFLGVAEFLKWETLEIQPQTWQIGIGCSPKWDRSLRKAKAMQRARALMRLGRDEKLTQDEADAYCMWDYFRCQYRVGNDLTAAKPKQATIKYKKG